MNKDAFLNLQPGDYQLTQPHADDIARMDRLLGRILHEHGEADLIETARKIFALDETADPKHLFEQFPELNNHSRLRALLRAYTVLFQLINLCEQKEIVRVNRQRQAQGHNQPRRESLLDTILAMKRQGVTAEAMQELLNRLDIQPTLTAHPTEARRRAVLDKLENLAHLLTQAGYPEALINLDESLNAPSRIEHEMDNALHALWLTEEISFNPVTVEDEVRNSVYFIEHTIFNVVPWLHRDLREALGQAYPEQRFEIPPFIRYRSWVGGDRDGNPNVTPQITWWTLLYHYRKSVQLYSSRIEQLLREYTQSARLVPPNSALLESLERDQVAVEGPLDRLKRHTNEPYAQKLIYIQARLHAMLEFLSSIHDFHTIGEISELPRIAYANAEAFLCDLRLIQESLRQGCAPILAEAGDLQDLIAQAQTFGFKLASLDIRQHSQEHEAVLDELFAASNSLTGRRYSELPETEKVRLLTNEMYNPRPLLPRGWKGSERAERMLDVFDVVHCAHQLFGPGAVKSYIISMTHAISDVLEVMVLAKEAGLICLTYQNHEPVLTSALDIVPLFETIEDLANSDKLLRELFTNQAYTMQLQARGHFQEVMLGYSDSSKDGGFMAANWYLNDTQARLADLCRRHEVDLQLFHGRGGTVGRGGGRAYLAIQAQAPGSMHGRIRFTEQGEVISFRYSYAPIAHRHLEQIIGAVMLASCKTTQSRPASVEFCESVEHMAEQARLTYRALVYDDPEFWEFYVHSTPIAHISHLPIASRPVSRKGRNLVGMEDLRAIPWVFSWVQSRYLISGWYGLGTALERFAGQDEQNLERMRRMYHEWSFFRLVLDNAQLELVRAHLPTAVWYASRVPSAETRERIHQQIGEEYHRTRHWILQITESVELLSHAETVRHTVELRNPIVMPLNHLQAALLGEFDRLNESKTEADEELREAMLLSIIGIAAAMQSTG